MMRSLRARALLLMLTVGCVSLALPARATLYAPIDDGELVKRATAVVVAQSLDSRVEVLPNGLPETRSRFAVLETLKGRLPEQIEVGVIGGVLPDGTELVVPGVPRFDANRLYLVALTPRPDGSFAVTELSLGSFDIVDDEAGNRLVTRMMFRGPATPGVFLVDGSAGARAEREPLRDLAGFASFVAAGRVGTFGVVPSYIREAKGTVLRPVYGETEGKIKPLWDSAWCPDGTMGRACSGSSLARWANGAAATVSMCDEDPSSQGQSGVVAGETLPRFNSALAAWVNAGGLGSAVKIGYVRGNDQSGNCNPDPVGGTGVGKVTVYLDDVSQFGGTAVTCPFPGGVLGIGGWLTNGTTHSYKNETWKTVLAGIGWIRRFNCTAGAFRADLFENVATHVLGSTLGFSNADISRHPFDTNPFDDQFSVMVSTYLNLRQPGLGSDDVNAACYVYGPCGGPACPNPGAPVLSAPQQIYAGENLCVTWTNVGGFDPLYDDYEIEVATDPGFTRLVHFYREQRTFVPVPTSVDAEPKTLYVRVKAKKDCVEGPKEGVCSNVAVVPVLPTGAAAVVTKDGANWFVRPGDPAPKATVKLRNVGSATTTVTLTTRGTFFDLSKTNFQILPGAEESFEVTAKAAAIATPGLSIGAVVATWIPPVTGDPNVLSVPISLNVADAMPAVPAGAVLTSTASQLVFSAPANQNPATQVVTFRVNPAPTSSQAVYLALAEAPLPPWLSLETAAGNLKVPTSGQLAVTFRVDRTRRSPTDVQPIQRSFVIFRLANDATAGREVFVDILDNEPPPVVPNAGPIRGGGTSWVVPSVVDGFGLGGSRFATDGWLRNICTGDAIVDLYFTPENKDGRVDPGVLKATTTVKAGHTVRLSALLRTFYNLTPEPERSISGQLEVKSPLSDTLTLRSNVEGKTGDGAETRYTAEVPTSAAGLLFGRLQFEAFAPGVSDDDRNRTNLILSETSGSEAFARITIYDPDGVVVGFLDNQRIPPNSKVQWNRIVDKVAPGKKLSNGSVGVKVIGGSGTLVGIITVLDNASNSFSILQLRCALVSGTPPYLVVPGAVRAKGVNNTLFSSNLYIVNAKLTPASLDLAYFYNDIDDGNKPKIATAAVQLPAYGSLKVEQSIDVLKSMFKLTGQTAGWIKIAGSVDRVFAASGASAQIDPQDASKGLKMSLVEAVAVNGCDIITRVLPPIRFAGVEKTLQKRTNFNLVEVGSDNCTVRIAAFTATGTLMAEKSIDLIPNQYFQINDIFGPSGFNLGEGPYQDIEVIAWIEKGEGKVVSFASVNDNLSRNPEIYVLRPSGCPYSLQ